MILRSIFQFYSSCLFTIIFSVSFVNSCFSTSVAPPPDTSVHLMSSPFDGLWWSGFSNHFRADKINTSTIVFSSGGAYLNGSNLPFDFSKKILSSSFIDSVAKSNVGFSKHHINFVEAGYRYGAGICFKKKSHWLGLELSDESISVIQYRKDLFNLMFYGNSQYEGDTAYLTGSGLNNQDFHRVRFIYSAIAGSDDSVWQINISLSYLQGYHVNSLNAGRSYLYTAPLGEYLSLHSQMVFQTNDTSSISAFATNGNGVSADLSISFVARKSKIFFSVNNAGFMHWNQNSLLYVVDTSVQFDGFEVNNFLHQPGIKLGNLNSDSIFSYLGINYSKCAFNLNLPLRLTFIWQHHIICDKLSVDAGFTFIPQYQFSPLYFISGRLHSKCISPSINISYGGNQAFNAGLSIEGRIANHINWFLTSDQMLSWALPKKLNGADLMASLYYQF